MPRRLTASARRAVRDPAWLRSQLHRARRDAWLRVRYRGDHLGFYRAVVQDDFARGATTAVDGAREARWQARGKRQLAYLREHGLKPAHRVLDIGCGNLRAGRRFIDYLDAGNYYGVDIAPAAILSAQQTVAQFGLADKLPYLTVVDDMRFAFLPAGGFDVVHAHSVFSHSPQSVVEECLANVGRLLAPGGHFDFTFNRAGGREHQTLREDFYYRTQTLLDLAADHGLRGEFMADWEASNPVQSKIRVSLAGG